MMAIQYARTSINEMAKILNVPPESIRAAANKARIRIEADDSFSLPQSGGQHTAFHRYLVEQPLTRAEQLRACMGIRPARHLPSDWSF